MKLRFFVLAIVAIFLINIVSADIIIQQNPSNLYNLGDTISVPIKITSLADTSNIFGMSLICNGAETEIVKLPISLTAGQETERNDPVPLIKGFIGDLTGDCRIKYTFGSEVKLTDGFKISNSISIILTTIENEFSPLQEITIAGQATKENGKNVDGFVDMELTQSNESKNIVASDTVRGGQFSLKFSLPKETAADQYLLKINIFEKDSNGEIINNGLTGYNILVSHVATNLETVLENDALEPGQILRVKAVMHDQTGQPMGSTATIIVKDSTGKILEQSEVATDSFLEVQIPSSNLPEKWAITSSSNGLESGINFNVIAVEKINTDIINKTLIVTNVGNVLYNHTLLVKIGDKPLNIDILLDVGESKKYLLSAPDGRYDIEVVANGKSSIDNVFLTGKAVDISEGGVTLENNTIIWIVIIIILAFFGVKLFKRLYKRSFFGYPVSSPIRSLAERKAEKVELRRTSVITKNKAELSLNVKGDQQDVSLVCLKIKNIDSLRESKTNYEAVLQQIINASEEQKAYVYGAQDSIFLIYAPTKTKTFRNERAALDVAKKASDLVMEYNKLAREKINIGVSVNHGTMVAGSEGNILKFMAMGTLMNSAKKLASLSDGELLLSEKMRDRLGADIKTQKKEVSGTTAYAVREIRDDEKSKEFIRKFMDRMQKGN